MAELIRGKTGRVYGHLMALFTTLKGLPLAYNKDMQEDKEGIFDSIDTLKMSLRVFAPMVETMKVRKEKMLAAAKEGFINATDLADYLTKKGLPFRRAHEVVGHLVLLCDQRGCDLSDLSLADFKAECELFEDDIVQALDIPSIVAARTTFGGTGNAAVAEQMESALAVLEADVQQMGILGMSVR
jgi:argininosuccinate lyase